MNIEVGAPEIQVGTSGIPHEYRPAFAILAEHAMYSPRADALRAYTEECTRRGMETVPTREMLLLHARMPHTGEVTFAHGDYRTALLMAGIKWRQTNWQLSDGGLDETEYDRQLVRIEQGLKLSYFQSMHLAIRNALPTDEREGRYPVSDFRRVALKVAGKRLPDDVDETTEVLLTLETTLTRQLDQVIPYGEITTSAGWTIDRRKLPPGVTIRGFELSPLTPTNYEMAELLAHRLPVGVQLTDLRLRYAEGDSFSISEDGSGVLIKGGSVGGIFRPSKITTVFPPFSAYLVRSLGLEQAQQIVTAEIIGNTDHELGHRFHLAAFRRYLGLAEAFLALLNADRERVGYDVLDPENGIGEYDQSTLKKLVGPGLEYLYLFEVVAEIWRISFHPELLAALKERFPNEYVMYRCMVDEDFLLQFASEHKRHE